MQTMPHASTGTRFLLVPNIFMKLRWVTPNGVIKYKWIAKTGNFDK